MSRLSRPIALIGLVAAFAPAAPVAAAVINFSGRTWDVRSGFSGPGPNHFSDSSDSVHVDAQGRLHMKIRKIGNTWYSAEITSRQRFGYGQYRFKVDTNTEDLNAQTVVGLFTYTDDTHEIDVELLRRGENTGHYAVQPYYNQGNTDDFKLNLTGSYSTHLFQWKPGEVFFQSYGGHYDHLPPGATPIEEWNYPASDTARNDTPTDPTHVHLNFYLKNGEVPNGLTEQQVVVSDFTFTPLPEPDSLALLGLGALALLQRRRVSVAL